MNFKLILIFILFLQLTNINAESHPFAGKTLSIGKSSIVTQTTSGNEISLNEKDIYIIPQDKAEKVPNYAPDKIYFSIKGDDAQQYYSFDKSDFNLLILSGEFGSWTKDKFIELTASKPEKNIAFMQIYQIDDDSNINVKALHGSKTDVLRKGSRFHFQQSPYGDSIVFVHTDKGLEQYFMDNEEQRKLLLAFKNDKILDLGAFSNYTPPVVVKEKAQGSPSKSPSTSNPKSSHNKGSDKTPPALSSTPKVVSGALKEVEEVLTPPKRKCEDENSKMDEDGLFESCDSDNNFLEPEIAKVLTPTDTYNEDPKKFCILASLNNSGAIKKKARCSNGKPDSESYAICKSKAYVDYLYKELTDMSSCLKNISAAEMIPLINTESRFNANAYNINPEKKTLNATGLLQTIHDVYKSGKQILRLNKSHGLFDAEKSPYCSKLLTDFTTNLNSSDFTKRDLCHRTDSVDNIRTNLFLAMAQYSNSKKQADKVISMIEDTWLNKSKIFNPDERKKMQIDIARLMHNRGARKVETLLEMFFYDLFQGSNPSTHNKRFHRANGKREGLRPDKTTSYLSFYESYPHGNPRIYPLWGRPKEFKAPLDHEAFSKYFSSYVFYEGSRVTIGNILVDKLNGEEVSIRKAYIHMKGPKAAKYIEPNHPALEAEGGTYLYKIECEQRRLTLDARKLASDNNITCDYPSASDERLKNIKGIIGWEKEVCNEDNKGVASRRLCVAKDPFKAKNSKGKRRLTDSEIIKFQNDDDYLGECDEHNLRGLAANPLAEFYSSQPDKYK